MSLTATFYNFVKTIDSTEIPTTLGTDFSIVLKERVSITAPVIELESSAIGYNYCYISAFSRYYFVQSVDILNNNRIQFRLSVDVLGTYKTEILNSSLYVLRSASDYNLKLVDPTWCHSTDFTETVTSVVFPSFSSVGCYLITVVNQQSSITANPASCMYLMSPSGMAELMEGLFDLDNYNNIDDLTATYFNPAQYITSCLWFPFAYNDMVTEQGTSFEDIKYGWYDAHNWNHGTAGGYRVVTYGKTLTFSVAVGTYTDWTDRSADWTRYALFIPGFGITEIDPQYSGETLSGKISVDYNTGLANLLLTTGTGQIVAQLSGKLGSEVAINQIGGSIDIPTNTGGLIAKGAQIVGASAAASSAVSGGSKVAKFLGSIVWGTVEEQQETYENMMDSGREIAGAVSDAVRQTILNPTVTTTGADGARYTITDNNTIYLYKRKYAHYNSAISKLGGMCNAVKTLSTLSGYTVVANGLIEMGGTVEERNAIVALLEGGFIIA